MDRRETDLNSHGKWGSPAVGPQNETRKLNQRTAVLECRMRSCDYANYGSHSHLPDVAYSRSSTAARSAERAPYEYVIRRCRSGECSLHGLGWEGKVLSQSRER